MFSLFFRPFKKANLFILARLSRPLRIFEDLLNPFRDFQDITAPLITFQTILRAFSRPTPYYNFEDDFHFLSVKRLV